MPASEVVVLATLAPFRSAMTTIPAAGALHEAPSRQTGDVGDFTTAPRMPLFATVDAPVAAVTSARIAPTMRVAVTRIPPTVAPVGGDNEPFCVPHTQHCASRLGTTRGRPEAAPRLVLECVPLRVTVSVWTTWVVPGVTFGRHAARRCCTCPPSCVDDVERDRHEPPGGRRRVWTEYSRAVRRCGRDVRAARAVAVLGAPVRRAGARDRRAGAVGGRPYEIVTCSLAGPVRPPPGPEPDLERCASSRCRSSSPLPSRRRSSVLRRRRSASPIRIAPPPVAGGLRSVQNGAITLFGRAAFGKCCGVKIDVARCRRRRSRRSRSRRRRCCVYGSPP